MRAESKPFDLAALSRRIDEAREERGLTMAALAKEVGVSASTIRRFKTADDAERGCDVGSLTRWSRV